jgi:hypothetical protein
MREIARRIIHWIACSRRPLKISEVEIGIVLCPGQVNLDETTRFRGSILKACGPILEERTGGVIDVVHFSAKE